MMGVVPWPVPGEISTLSVFLTLGLFDISLAASVELTGVFSDWSDISLAASVGPVQCGESEVSVATAPLPTRNEPRGCTTDESSSSAEIKATSTISNAAAGTRAMACIRLKGKSAGQWVLQVKGD